MALTRRALLSALPLLFLVRPRITRSQNGLGVYSLPVSSQFPNCQYIQTHLQWNQIGWDSHNWQSADALLNPLINQGYRLILMITGSPGMSAGCSERNLLDAQGSLNQVWLSQFESLIRVAMVRYPGQWWAWEEESDSWWDTPNGGWGGKPAEYLEVLRIMARARAEVDPSARLLLSPVARENWAPAHERPSFDMDFLASVASLGAFDLVDYWGCNYYAPGFYPWHGSGSHSVIAKLQKARDSLPTALRNRPLVVNTGHILSGGGADYTIRASDYVNQSIAHLWAAPFVHGLNVIAQTQFIWQPKREDDRLWGLTDSQGVLTQSGRVFEKMSRIPSRPIGATRLVCPGKDGYRFDFADGSQKLMVWTSCADMDNDGIISARDTQETARHWHESGECLRYDLNGDGVVSVVDIQEVARRFGEGC